MKKNLFAVIGLLCMICFLSCAGTEVKNDPIVLNEPSNGPLQKTITIIDMPEHFNGMSGDISFAVYDENGIFDWIAWSEPVIILNDSVTNVLLVQIMSEKTGNPFNQDGEFIIYFKINEEFNEGFPYWQGYIHGLNITEEYTIIPWSMFGEVQG